MNKLKTRSRNRRVTTSKRKINIETGTIRQENKKNNVMLFVFITLAALLLRCLLFVHQSGDYKYYLSEWINKLKEYDGLSGIGQNIGEYNVPYMLFLNIISLTPINDLIEIKIFSIIFDFAGAYIAVKIISDIRNTKFFTSVNMIVYSVILFNPVVFLDSAYWGQCDFIYTSMIMFSVYYMIREKFTPAMIFYGIAFAFKLQAILFLPVIFMYYFFSEKMRIKYIFWIPAVYFISIVPALAAGRGLKDTLSIYISQTGIYKNLTMNCPNIYYFLKGDYDVFKNAGIILTMGILGAGALLFIIKKKNYEKSDLLLLTLWVTQTCICFLPSMHERYSFMPCIFSILLAAVYKKELWIGIVINSVGLLSFMPYLADTEIIKLKYLAIINILVFIFLSLKLFVKSQKHNYFKAAA